MGEREIRVIERVPGRSARIEGELTEAGAPDFESQLRSLAVDGGSTFTLDLSGLDIEDGFGVAAAVSALRGLRRRAGGLVLVAAPQMLGHNLYRVGLLEGPEAVELVDMRLDEPSGS